jgi:hypothetical protein
MGIGFAPLRRSGERGRRREMAARSLHLSSQASRLECRPTDSTHRDSPDSSSLQAAYRR